MFEPIKWSKMYRWLLLERLVSSNKTSCRASFSPKIKNIPKRKSKREFAKIVVSSQGESQLQTQFQDRVSSQVQESQANSCVAFQGQVLTQTQLTSQNNVSSQSTVASQGQAQTEAQMASQHNVSSQDRVETQAQNVFSQPIVPTLSQISSQRSVSSSQGAVSNGVGGYHPSWDIIIGKLDYKCQMKLSQQNQHLAEIVKLNAESKLRIYRRHIQEDKFM